MKIAIFHVTSTFVLGGSETHVWKLGRALQDRGHICHLWGGAVDSLNILDESIQLRTARFTPRKKFPKLGNRFQKLMERVTFAWNANGLFAAERYDIISIHKPYDIPAALWWKHKTGAKIVWRCHGSDFYPGLGSLAAKVDAIYCVSEFARKTLVGAFNVNADVIHTGVDTVFYSPRASQQTPSPVPKLLYFGRLEGWKGVLFLVEALGQLRHRPWTAEIVGNGPEWEAVAKRIQALDLGTRVRLRAALKQREAVRELLAESDIVVFPAVGAETFSNALLEAMSMGKAVIATEVGVSFPP